MNISYAWIKSILPGLTAGPQELADLLAMQGAPVDEIVDIGGPLRDIRIARVIEAGRHPNADRLSLCRVDDGTGEIRQVVCGAPNVKSGGIYPFAPVGAHLPGDVVIKRSKIRGEESQGMLCSARELGLGREHDGIMELPSDTPVGASLVDVLQLDDARIVVDVTPNRADLLSHLGVARELGAALDIEPRLSMLPGVEGKLDFELTPRSTQSEAGGISVDIRDTDLCPRYLGLVIRNVKIAPSPAWLAGRLRAIGLRPINNVVDATNYVLHELGQPLHAFDSRKLGTQVVVRRAEKGERITTLDGVDRALASDMLVIADAEKPVAVAGVMGGADSEVDNETTDILLECALFDTASVRRTRRALGLSTDASYRYERGVDPDTMEIALRRAAALIIACAGGAVAEKAVDAGVPSQARREISLRLDRVAKVLGVAFDAKAVTRLLAPLGFDVTGSGDVLQVHVPGHRIYDVSREADLIEEIARRHGYDAFPDELRAFRPSSVPDDASLRLEDRLREKLVGLRMLESRSLAFAPAAYGEVALMLPLSSAEGYLRNAIVPALLRRIEYNYSRGQRHIRLFEIATAFLNAGSRDDLAEKRDGHAESAATAPQLPREQRRLAATFTGSRAAPHWTGNPPAFDMWDLNGFVSVLAADLALTVQHADSETPLPSWADHAAAWVITRPDGSQAGVGAKVKNEAVDAPAWADPVFAVEIDLTALGGESTPKPVKPLPAFPAVERDLALLVRLDLPAADVIEAIQGSAGPLLEAAFPFDVYRGKGVNDALRSVAIRLRFRAPDRTLTDEEVDRAVTRTLARLQEDHGIERRA
ncbi:MAG: phenylalanine--tRNA ligase subunit beta [Longimicrobiales bacterium]